MQILQCRSAYLLLGVGLSVCASTLANAQPDSGDVQAPPVARLGADLPAFAGEALPPLEEQEGELGLRQALALALLRHPRMAAFHFDRRAEEAARVQAGALPNPELVFELENFAGSGAWRGTTSAEATLALSQQVELGGKRGKRLAAARGQVDVAGWDYEVARVETYTETALAYYEVLAAQEQLQWAARIVTLAQELERAVSERVDAGGTLALERNRARAAAETSIIERDLAQRRLQATRTGLAATWGSDAARFRSVQGDLDVVPAALPSWEQLQQHVLHTPELSRWQAEIERRGALVGIARAQRVPDVGIGLGARHDNASGDTGLVLWLAAPLPVLDRRGGDIGAAEARVQSARAQQQARAIEVRRLAAILYEAMETSHIEVLGLRENVLPQSDEAAARSRQAYAAGALGLTDVLDIQRTFYRQHVRYVEALANFHAAVVQLEGLLGTSVVASAATGNDNNGEGDAP